MSITFGEVVLGIIIGIPVGLFAARCLMPEEWGRVSAVVREWWAEQ